MARSFVLCRFLSAVLPPMKVFDLICRDGHRFEGWFGSADDYAAQSERGVVLCPLCESSDVQRAPSAPRLNLSGANAIVARDVESANEGTARSEKALVASVIERLRKAVAETENVGSRFAEEARRIHYEEVPPRAIRGTATAAERHELGEEGIETLSIPAGTWTETLQ